MGDEDDGAAALLLHAEEVVVEFLARDLVERGERLVHEEEPWLRGEGARDRDPHLHAA
jgi:hypothetical protein